MLPGEDIIGDYRVVDVIPNEHNRMDARDDWFQLSRPIMRDAGFICLHWHEDYRQAVGSYDSYESALRACRKSRGSALGKHVKPPAGVLFQLSASPPHVPRTDGMWRGCINGPGDEIKFLSPETLEVYRQAVLFDLDQCGVSAAMLGHYEAARAERVAYLTELAANAEQSSSQQNAISIADVHVELEHVIADFATLSLNLPEPISQEQQVPMNLRPFLDVSAELQALAAVKAELVSQESANLKQKVLMINELIRAEYYIRPSLILRPLGSPKHGTGDLDHTLLLRQPDGHLEPIPRVSGEIERRDSAESFGFTTAGLKSSLIAAFDTAGASGAGTATDPGGDRRTEDGSSECRSPKCTASWQPSTAPHEEPRRSPMQTRMGRPRDRVEAAAAAAATEARRAGKSSKADRRLSATAGMNFGLVTCAIGEVESKQSPRAPPAVALALPLLRIAITLPVKLATSNLERRIAIMMKLATSMLERPARMVDRMWPKVLAPTPADRNMLSNEHFALNQFGVAPETKRLWCAKGESERKNNEDEAQANKPRRKAS
ncbi:hypothetical protein HDU96_010430 [Phlyctochytrium bullatum]|nr:hypothetical protein HDU96_010430 [Phlyctochytrium bullatum]